MMQGKDIVRAVREHDLRQLVNRLELHVQVEERFAKEAKNEPSCFYCRNCVVSGRDENQHPTTRCKAGLWGNETLPMGVLLRGRVKLLNGRKDCPEFTR